MSSSGTTIPIANTNLVVIVNTQAAIKLNGNNFPAQKVQFNVVLVGYDLLRPTGRDKIK